MPANVQSDLILEENEVFSDTLGSSEDEETSFLKKPSSIARTPTSQPQDKPITFESTTTKRDHEPFLRECLEILLKEAVFDVTARKTKVIEFRQPEEMLKIFDFQLKQEPTTQSAMQRHLRDIVKYSVKTGHPYFVNQLFSSVDPYGLIGQLLTDTLNCSAYTYEVAPVIILMEETVLREMRQIVGWRDGEGDGIFCPGGSLANGYAISCARHHYFPDVKTKGLHSVPKLALFTSQDAHYSVKKLAAFMGLGTENVNLVRTDVRGKMDPEHLEELIKEAKANGAKPFLVCATGGTTVLGAFDPIDKLAEICKKHDIWLHVDAAWGGGSLMSKKRRALLKGVEKADSIVWNPHKLLSAPQQCSTFLTKHKKVLTEAHSQNAVYLFQKDKFYNTDFDTGDKHIQCGRKADVLKFWFMWKAKGTSGLEKHIDKIYENARTFLELIRNRPGFELVLPEPECTNICFWYVPESLRKGDFKENMLKKEFKESLHQIAPKMKEKMMREGTMMVSYQTHHDQPNFFRIVFQNSSLDKSDMLHLVEEFERLAKGL